MPTKNLLKEFLQECNLTAYRFWQQTGLAHSTAFCLCRNSNAVPTGDILKTICRTYSVQPGDILKYEPGEEQCESCSDCLQTYRHHQAGKVSASRGRA